MQVRDEQVDPAKSDGWLAFSVLLRGDTTGGGSNGGSEGVGGEGGGLGGGDGGGGEGGGLGGGDGGGGAGGMDGG